MQEFDYQLKVIQKGLKKEALNISCDGYLDCPPLIKRKKKYAAESLKYV